MRIDPELVTTFWQRTDNVTLEERVYRFIHERIVAGDAPPGSSIVGSAIASTLGVSRITVANALRRLSSEGFVIVYPHRGAEVTALDEATLDEIFRIRYALEAEIMVALATSIDRTGMMRLRELDNRIRESLARDDSHTYRQLERRFHLLIYELSGLPMIAALLTDLWDRLEPYRGRRFAQQMLAREAMDDHERVLAALEAGDGDAAVVAMRKHVERGHTHLKEVLRPRSPNADDLQPAIPPGPGVRRPRREPPPSGSLREALDALPDARRSQGRMYRMGDILTLWVCATLCGTRSRHAAASWIANASPSLLEAVGWSHARVPSIPTIQRAIGGTDVEAMQATLARWLDSYGYVVPEGSCPYGSNAGQGALSSGEMIHAITESLTEHLNAMQMEGTHDGDSAWRRFFGRMLYGTELPPELTPAELHLRMAYLHTAGSDMPLTLTGGRHRGDGVETGSG